MNGRNPQDGPDDSREPDLDRPWVIRNLETGQVVLATETIEVDPDGGTMSNVVPLTEPAGPEGNS